MLEHVIHFCAIAPGAAADQPPFFLQPPFVTMILMVLFMYFALIRPQQKKQKDHESMLSKLEKNDAVITTGGLHGVVVGVFDKTVTIKIAENVKVEVEKASIVQNLKSEKQS